MDDISELDVASNAAEADRYHVAPEDVESGEVAFCTPAPSKLKRMRPAPESQAERPYWAPEAAKILGAL